MGSSDFMIYINYFSQSERGLYCIGMSNAESFLYTFYIFRNFFWSLLLFLGQFGKVGEVSPPSFWVPWERQHGLSWEENIHFSLYYTVYCLYGLEENLHKSLPHSIMLVYNRLYWDEKLH